ncbi:MAG: carboxypeptidase regulatory-like domain-containing protein [Candidatus Marinimicrobia bacterium]|nr:carboxypeptidase regulatory-like domain-containing protein [Candidatus Neomarinimicrobiota bacterium]MBL7023181.1 carboxypeptidase regulatory-like domain-containing protein [Candidatus Neomarinimicrobiota bacterium]MBL7109236.1 carboxypeptidase regulatory-like domain-containing protein [Candidatus Neomarinimicrobiota bacterium]
MKSRIYIIINILIAVTVLMATNNTEKYFKFSVQTFKEVNALSKIVSIDHHHDGLEIYAYANENEFAEFVKLGYDYEILQNPSMMFEPKMASSKDQMRDWDSYPTYSTYVDMMYQFAEDYPDLCVVENIGSSVEGRELLIAKISDNVNVNENEPEFLYTATMHGDEIVGYVLMLRLIDHLLSNYSSDSQVANLVDNAEIWINPLSNPDGTYNSSNNSVWGATRSNANGVDLNRNYPDPQDGQHPDGNSWQPETIAFMALADEHNFILSSNLHSGAEVVNYPWDTWSQRHADDDWWQDVSHTYADAAQSNSPYGYMSSFDDGITNGYDWYSIDGGRQDYMNYFHGCREMTLELSNEKLLPENELLDHWTYNKDSFMYYMEETLYGIRGIVTNESGTPLNATIEIIGHDFDNSHIFTDPEVGNYHRMIAPGSYNLLVSSFGYISQTINNVYVSNGNITVVDIVLDQAQTVDVSGNVIDGDTGLPIQGATVELLDTPISPVTTNSNGDYTILNILEDTYTIRVSKLDYATVSQTVQITEQNNEFNFTLFESNAESFEGGFSADWDFSGNANWSITSSESYDGSQSAKSGNISDNQTSTMSITMNITSSGEISFFRKVSSESSYDYLKFYIDGSERDSWSGEVSWGEESYSVNSGNHTFKWTFDKDGSVSNGSDCGWVDYIIFPPTEIPPAPEFGLSPSSLAFGEVALGETSIQQFTISNNGDATLTGNISTPTGYSVQNGRNSLNYSISAGNTQVFDLAFSPLYEVTYNGNVSITSNDSNHPLNYLSVSGSGFDQQIPPIAEFEADATSGSIPLTISFTDLSTQGNSDIINWFWDFGDGGSSTLQYPLHTFEEVGNFTISLTITDENGLSSTETKTNYISANDEFPPNYPDWNVDFVNFEFNMALAGLLFINDEESYDNNDVIGAFADDECRGVAYPTYFPVTGHYTVNMMIYGNTNGETITFKAYDYSEDMIFDNVQETLTFVNNDIVGDDINPFELHAISGSEITLDFMTGWNWFSVNLIADDMGLDIVLSSIEGSAEFIKGQMGFANYYEEFGWYSGSGLTEIDNNQMYMIEMISNAEFSFSGSAVDYQNSPIDLVAGWNWIGYLPQSPNNLNDALISIEPNGVFIKNQNGFANYYDDFGWYSGSGLNTMSAGDGFMLQMSTEDQLVYGIPVGLVKVDDEIKDFHWEVNPHLYEYNMALTAIIELENSDFELVAFVGNECRGVASPTYFPLNEKNTINMMIYGESGEILNFKLYNRATNEEIELVYEISFEADAIIGNDLAPILLRLEQEIPKSFVLLQNYPNPFNPVTEIGFELPVDSYISLSVYNLNGQKIIDLAEGYKPSGYYSVKWDGHNLYGEKVSSGVYIYKLTSDNFSTVKKMLLMK